MGEEKSVFFNTNDRVIKLFGNVNEESSKDIINAMMRMEKDEPRDSIDFYINSYGGYTHDMLAIYDTMQNLKCKVNTIALGKAMSAGCFLLLTGTGVRKSYKNTRIMLHGIQFSCSYDSLADQEIKINENREVEKIVADIIVEHTGNSREKVEQDIKRDMFLSSKEALDYSIIDEII